MDDELFAVFNEIISLRKNYSLADYNFFDSNHCFPDKGIDWMAKNLGIEKKDVQLEGWLESEKDEINNELESCLIIDKKYHWREVKQDYFDRHYFGLTHMNKNTFLFYFPAWIHLCMKNNGKLNLTNEFFIGRLASINFHDESYFNWLNIGQKKLVVNFLQHLSEKVSDEVMNRDVSLACSMWSSAI